MLISLDRYLSVLFVKWGVYFKKTKVLIAAYLVVITFILVNAQTLFTFGYRDIINGTEVVYCFALDSKPSTKIMDIWNTLHAFLYSYIPFVILFITNILLVITVKAKSKLSAVKLTDLQKRKKKLMNITVISVTLLFICFTLPGAVVSSMYNALIQSYTGTVLLFLGDTLQFSYHSLNLIILLITNKKFSSKLVCLLFGKASPEAQSALNTS